MTAEFSLPIRVYIEDTDAGGIVYYVNYLKYLERARTELMRTFGFERAAVSDAGWNLVVSDMSLSYKEPARLDDQLRATAVISARRLEFCRNVGLPRSNGGSGGPASGGTR